MSNSALKMSFMIHEILLVEDRFMTQVSIRANIHIPTVLRRETRWGMVVVGCVVRKKSFLEILKRELQNIQKILKTCFLVAGIKLTIRRVSLQSPVFKGLNLFYFFKCECNFRQHIMFIENMFIDVHYI